MSNISITRVSLTNCCPACGKGKIYKAILSVNEKCEKCNFKIKEHDAGDGPAFFAMSIAGTIVVLLALVIEVKMQIPLWFHLVLWVPITIILSIYFLRLSKSFLIASQYKNDVLGFKNKN